ncbi:hypothetical protein [Microbispora sp. NPDC049633]|uniref:hypothetical protein n=1 Tax=Microbispora sp. NPDC049633 TaxID=3154355 RepID=UPI003420CDBD
MTWEALPTELAEIFAEITADLENDEIDPDDEPIEVVEARIALRRRYHDAAVRLGICNVPGCLRPNQGDRAPWCAEMDVLAADILAEMLAEETAEE